MFARANGCLTWLAYCGFNVAILKQIQTLCIAYTLYYKSMKYNLFTEMYRCTDLYCSFLSVMKWQSKKYWGRNMLLCYTFTGSSTLHTDEELYRLSHSTYCEYDTYTVENVFLAKLTMTAFPSTSRGNLSLVIVSRSCVLLAIESSSRKA